MHIPCIESTKEILSVSRTTEGYVKVRMGILSKTKFAPNDERPVQRHSAKKHYRKNRIRFDQAEVTGGKK